MIPAPITHRDKNSPKKRVLFLAPQPFFVTRGTPIAVKMLCEVLRDDYDIDVICYPLGEEVQGVRILRCYAPGWLTRGGVKAGASIKKLFLDIFFFITAFRALRRARTTVKRYDIIHGIEEGAIIAYLLKLIFKVPYIYDMDSNLADSLVAKWKFLKPIHRLLAFFENRAIINSSAVVVMCEALEDDVRKLRRDNIYLLKDVPQQLATVEPDVARGRLVSEIALASLAPADAGADEPGEREEAPLLYTYVGNLEHYQGIDLLLEHFDKACADPDFAERAHLVIVGGDASSINSYQAKYPAATSRNCHFLGPRPLDDLSWILAGSDILVSPRISGTNTPMKLYSYVSAHKPILATDLPTHTQLLSSENACLKRPDEFYKGFLEVMEGGSREELAARVALVSLPSFDEFRAVALRVYAGV